MAIILRYEKSRPSRSLVLYVFGFAFGVVALLIIVKLPIDIYRENKQAKWPSVVATITTQSVRRGRLDDWRIESEVRYSVDGEDLTSSIYSREGAFWEELSMRRWVSHHPPGTPLSIRYDPEHHDTVILDARDMPESGPQVADDLQMLLTFSALSITLITIGRVLRSRREESSMLNRDNTNE